MSLDTLDRFDQNTAKAILAEAVLSRDHESSNARFKTEISDIFREIRNRLKISDQDFSKGSEQKIERFISDEITRLIMMGVDKASLNKKLGSLGKLPIGGYEIEFLPGTLKDFRENRKHVEDIIKNPDEFQHLSGNIIEDKSARGATLFLKWIHGVTHSGHWILVDTMRDGAVLSVASILRIDPKKINLENSRTPLDMLRAYATSNGVEFEIKGVTTPTKFLENCEFEGNPEDQKRKFVGDPSRRKYLETGSSVEIGVGDKVIYVRTCIIYAYAIDMARYIREKPMK